MTPEQIQGVRAGLALSAEATPGQVEEMAYQAAVSLYAERAEMDAKEAAWTAERSSLQAEKAAAIQLSADNAPRRPDPVVAAMYGDNIAAKREAAIASGAVSEAQAKLFDALIVDATGAPTLLALSATGPAKRPLGFELWDRLCQLGKDGIRTGSALPRGVTEAVAASADGDEKMSLERRNALRREAGLQPLSA